MSDMVDLVRVLTSATGNSTPITLGVRYSDLFMTPADANAVDGRTYTYLIVDGNNWELGKGVYTASGTTLARTTILASRSAGTLGTSRIVLSGTAQVRFVYAAEDIGALRGTRAVTGTSDVIAQNDLGRAITYSNASPIAASIAQAGASSLFLDGWSTEVKNTGAGALTVTPATSTINGAATLVLAQNLGAFIWSDGTNFHAYIMPITKPLLAANNLADVASAAMARGNLGSSTVGDALFTASSAVGARGTLGIIAPPQGRLTLLSGNPVMTTTQSAKTTVFYTPYHGNMVPIFDGANMAPTAFSELAVLTTDTTKSPAAIAASKVNDWFIWNDGGTLRLSHGPDWTSDTARSAGTALVMVNGILLNSVAITNGPAASRGTYVGTTRSNASSQLDWIFGASSTGGIAGFFGVWNCYNRVNITTSVTDTTNGYNYAGGTARAANASNGNRVSFVSGLAEDGVEGAYWQQVTPANSAFSYGIIGIALDTTSAFDRSMQCLSPAVLTTAIRIPAFVSNAYPPQLGFHFVQAIEGGDGSTTISFNNSGVGNEQALVVRWRA